MFDDKIGLMMELLDTDYDKYIIGYECYDNMQFALETEDVEPVHIITMGIATRNPDESPEFLAELEKKALEKLPFLKQEDLAEVKQGKKGKCDYQIEFWRKTHIWVIEIKITSFKESVFEHLRF